MCVVLGQFYLRTITKFRYDDLDDRMQWVQLEFHTQKALTKNIKKEENKIKEK